MLRLHGLRMAGVLGLAILQSACATATTSGLTGSEAAVMEQAAAMAASVQPGPYRLGLGDKLRVIVFGESDLSGEFQVSGGGTVSMPLIGDVQAVGLTAAELQDRLTTRYQAGYMRDPKIAVEVYDFRPFFILGEVAKPGRFPATEGLTVEGAIATAGGLTYRGDANRLYIRRAGDSAERQVSLSSNTVVQPGDVIRVGERRF